MMDLMCHLRAVDLLRKQLKHTPFPVEKMKPLTRESFMVINAVPPVYGFVITSYALYLPKNHYLFCIYAKVPDHAYLYVSRDWYSTRKECEDELRKYLTYFPIYGFTSRNFY